MSQCSCSEYFVYSDLGETGTQVKAGSAIFFFLKIHKMKTYWRISNLKDVVDAELSEVFPYALYF